MWTFEQRVALLIRLLLQNAGRLASNKRRHFAELTVAEIQRMEAAVQEIIGSFGRTVAEAREGAVPNGRRRGVSRPAPLEVPG